MSDELSKAIIRLYDQERFYAELLLQMDRIISKRVPTLGVCVKDRIQLYVNLEFFNALSKGGVKAGTEERLPDEQVAVLKHECQHILNDHISRAKEIAPEVYAKKGDAVDSMINGMKHQVVNIAADCSINPGIPDAPKNGVFPKMFDLADGHTMEWYLDGLKNNEKLKELTHYDDHSLWGESDGEKEEIKQKILKAVNKAGENTRGAGKLTSDQELLIDKLNYKARDWKSDLRRFAARTQEVALTTSKKKRNRRYGIMYPGSVKEEKLHIGVAIDTSGSVSNEALCQFMAEIANIARYALVTVVEADAEVKNSYVFDTKKTYTISGRGGTAYQPAFDFFTNNTEVDGVIYFGDMDIFDREELKKPSYPVMWAIVGPQGPPASWGSVTKVEITNK